MLTFFGRGSAFTDHHNSAYFEDGKDLVIIDFSMTSFQLLNDFDLASYDHIYILITHTHGDHVSGLGMIIDLLEFSVQTPITIIAPSDRVKDDIRYLLREVEGCEDSWYELICCCELDKPWFNAVIPTSHTEELAGKCFGFHLTIDGKSVVYTGDTNTLAPYEEYLTDGCYLYTEVSAYNSPVHLYYVNILEDIKRYEARGIHVFLMHMDDEAKILKGLEGTYALPAPLRVDFKDDSEMLGRIYEIADSLYRDMCMDGSTDHNMLFSYVTQLGKIIAGADRASFWKWDRRKRELWTMSATGVDKIVIPDDSGLVGKALKDRKPLITNDPYSDPAFNREVDIKTGYKTKSILVLPVADINGRTIGALQLINKNDEKGFDPKTDPHKLSLAALVCGIALESETFLEDSHHDKLTGLKNRMGFYHDFQTVFKPYTGKDSDKVMSVFICDIDKFKRVNDTYGHNAGDDVLAFTAGLLESCCGANENIYRWGGEEFVMVMAESDLKSCVAKAEEIRVKLMGSDIEADGNTIKCTLSFGCTLYDPAKSIEENISTADGWLYKAKETGRNRVCFE
ncbi:MAG: diguanylate cyclase [Saccharofermentans sp.]|nr:diguanylate cyclase [Saccharofermentans sp.]